MTNYRHIAFMPVMNAGMDRVSPFAFSCGAKLELGQPEPVRSILPQFAMREDLSGWESTNFVLARAWLWIASVESPESIEEDRNVFRVCGDLARRAWTIRSCIDIAGGGENDYWRYSNSMHCAGVYVHSIDIPHLPYAPISRRHFMFSPPTQDQRLASWSPECLKLADRLVDALLTYQGGVIPRLALAIDLRDSMTRFDARRTILRFQLAVTAIETFFIAPNERRYVWDDPIRDRIRSVCLTTPGLDDAFFEKLKERRNDAVHRAGLDRMTKQRPRYVNIEAKTEEVLRESLQWGILNQELIAAAFEKDQWPKF